MRITSKGQVTIPIHIREKAGFMPNTEVEFVLDGDSVQLVRAASNPKASLSRGEMIVRKLQGDATTTLSTDEIMRLMRGEG